VATKFRIGTASWTDPGFIEDWYPPKLPKSQLLRWYAGHFNYVEVNATFHKRLTLPGNLPSPPRKLVRKVVHIAQKRGLVFPKTTHQKSLCHESPSLIGNAYDFAQPGQKSGRFG
jgi:hypothetical protein